jgi:hypothetical protein
MGKYWFHLQKIKNNFFVGSERCPDCKCLRSPKKHLFAVWILFCIFRLTSLFGVTRDPKYTNSLTTSKVLSPKATLCPTSRIVLSFPAAIIYLVLLSLNFNPVLFASPAPKTLPGRLLGSCR